MEALCGKDSIAPPDDSAHTETAPEKRVRSEARLFKDTPGAEHARPVFGFSVLAFSFGRFRVEFFIWLWPAARRNGERSNLDSARFVSYLKLAPVRHPRQKNLLVWNIDPPIASLGHLELQECISVALE